MQTIVQNRETRESEREEVAVIVDVVVVDVVVAEARQLTGKRLGQVLEPPFGS